METGFIWPEERVPSAAIRDWVASTFPPTDVHSVVGPTTVYRVNDWGVTARFALLPAAQADDSEDVVGTASVVCKVGLTPLSASSPAIYHALALCAPGSVPRLLASRSDAMPREMDGVPMAKPQTWLMFAPFSGRAVRSFRNVEPIVEMAKVMGRVQVAFAALPERDKRDIPRAFVAELPAQLDTVLRDVRETYAPFWREHRQRLVGEHGMDESVQERLADERTMEEYRARVVAWVGELMRYRESDAWRDSIDHLDLHTNNAVVLDEGDASGIKVLIYDWEEASVGCPFFSLANLLENARRLEPTPAAPSLEAQVRLAYLNVLPWGVRSEREEAFDLALKLAPLRRLYETRQLFRSLGVSTIQTAGGKPMEEAVVVAGYLADALTQ
ncbi:MAG: hypothetical protein H8F28_02950 [Fibrella sp.]|nr:hypothetical protein [Armatimonadota bacterium]